MPSKQYNMRFPGARIKKIMQTDEEIGKVSAAVPLIISRALELFLESLLKKAGQVTQSQNAKTMTISHLKQCMELEQQFDFLKDLVAAILDMRGDREDNHLDGEKGAPRGRKPGSSQKNGGAGGKGKRERQKAVRHRQQENDSEDTETDGEEEIPRPPAQPSGPPAPFQSPPAPFLPFSFIPPFPPVPPGPSSSGSATPASPALAAAHPGPSASHSPAPLGPSPRVLTFWHPNWGNLTT
ncbi:LOW QUALITY PROTEIN: uncharacterized protein LOC141562648 [Sminthopsis crassicaudata]|uniref:LOW QUALITY PROTEIN: uncharacterized protein LOC141562648 n=1 Tax=Sminthopsis crassicaudata TaxID=9301 RepID=UPI003D68F69A